MKLTLARCVPASLFLLTAPSAAQTFTAVVKDNDPIAGVGNITSIDNLAINNSGLWLVEADTDNANTVIDSVILKGGVLFLREGDALTLPAGASVGSFDGLSISAGGDVGWNLFLDGLTGTTDSGVFFNSTLVIQESSFSIAPQFSPSTPYTGWFDARLNDAHQMLLMSSVDDAAIPSTTDRALVVATVLPSGALFAEGVISKEGGLINGEPIETVTDFGTTGNTFAFNNLGQAIFFADLTGSTVTDGLIVIGDVSTTTIVAREGSPSGISGRSWQTLSSKAVDINDGGQYVMRGDLDGAITDDDVITLNGSIVIAREGASLPAISPFVFTTFGSGSIAIDNSSNVFWLGDWNDPDTTRDVGLFRNHQLLVQEGVTVVGGQTIESIATVEDNFVVSPDGRYVLFECKLTGGVDAAVLLDLDGTTAAQRYCFGDGSGTACPCSNVGTFASGCPNFASAAGGQLQSSGVASIASDSLVLQSSSVLPFGPGLYFQGSAPIVSGVVFGNGLVCVTGATPRLEIRFADALGVSASTVSIHLLGSDSAGDKRYYQMWYRDDPSFCAGAGFNLTNALSLTWIP